MNVRKVNTEKDIRDYYFRLATHLAGSSVCTMLLAMNEEFGIGPVRLKRLVERYTKITRRLNDYGDGDKSDAELRNRLEELGLEEFATAMLKMHDIEDYRRDVKKMNAVSIKEAAEAQEMLRIMKGLR